MGKTINNQNSIKKTKNIFSVPYQGTVKTSYFTYSGLFLILGLLVYIFSLFIIINLASNNKYHISSNINDINITVTPVFNLGLVSVALILLLLAPQRVHHSTKQSAMMFYLSFWMLVVSTLLNSQLQLTYIDSYVTTSFYNWLNVAFIKVLIVISVISLFFIEIFFWIMRHKFTFMPTDYEIYMTRSDAKYAKKKAKSQIKLIKKHDKLNSKIKKSHLKTQRKLQHKLQKEVRYEK